MCPLIAPALCLEAHSRPKSGEGYPEQAMEISLRLNFREAEAGGSWGKLCTFQRRQRSVEKESQKSVKESSRAFAGSQDVHAEVNLHGVVRK